MTDTVKAKELIRALLTKELIRALLTADTEDVSKILDEDPEMAYMDFPKADVKSVYEELESESKNMKTAGPRGAVYIHPPYYDASDGYKYKQGYRSADASSSSMPDEIAVRQRSWRYSSVSDRRLKNETTKPIMLCCTPAHKEIVKNLIAHGANICAKEKNDDYTLMRNVIDGFPAPGASSEGIREYAEYIKWIVSQGASMANVYRETPNSVVWWKTLYDKFYEGVIEYYAIRTVEIFSWSDSRDGEMTREEKNAVDSLDILKDLTEYLFKDIDAEKYIPYETYASDATPDFQRSRALRNVPFLNFTDALNRMESHVAIVEHNGTKISDETYGKLIRLLSYPVERLLGQFSGTELRYICQNKGWYRDMASKVIKRSSPDSGWQKFWDMLNRHVGVKDMYISDTPVSDCISYCACQNDIPGKAEAYASALGHISERDKRRLWPAVADAIYSIYKESKDSMVTDYPKRKREYIEDLCRIAEKYGGDINRRNSYTGRAPLHTLCRNIAKDCVGTRKDKYLTPRENAGWLTRTAHLLKLLEHYGADLSVKDEEGRTPIEAFPKSLASAITKCLAQMDYERSALIESEEIYIR